MSRPVVDAALAVIADLVENGGAAEERHALRILRRAVKPREVWPSKEASEYLGVQTAHLPKLRGLPAPAQVLDRPSRTHPEKKAYLYYADEIREFGIGRRRAGRGGS